MKVYGALNLSKASKPVLKKYMSENNIKGNCFFIEHSTLFSSFLSCSGKNYKTREYIENEFVVDNLDYDIWRYRKTTLIVLKYNKNSYFERLQNRLIYRTKEYLSDNMKSKTKKKFISELKENASLVTPHLSLRKEFSPKRLPKIRPFEGKLIFDALFLNIKS